MPLSRRYQPEHPPGEQCLFGMDFSFVLPPGAVIESGTLVIYENTFVPGPPSTDWTVGPVQVEGTALYAQLSGGVQGTDYQLIWTAADTDSNLWPRTALVLCAATS